MGGGGGYLFPISPLSRPVRQKLTILVRKATTTERFSFFRSNVARQTADHEGNKEIVSRDFQYFLAACLRILSDV